MIEALLGNAAILLGAVLLMWVVAVRIDDVSFIDSFRGGGMALLEAGLAKRRPGYANYLARTSGFFPLPPRRH